MNTLLKTGSQRTWYRSQRGVAIGLFAVMALPILIIFIGLGLETVRAKYLRASMDQEAANLCSAIVAEAPYQARAIERFQSVLKDAVEKGKFRGSRLVGARLIFPTQPGTIMRTAGKYATPYSDTNWRNSGYKVCPSTGELASRPPDCSGSACTGDNIVKFGTMDSNLSCTSFLDQSLGAADPADCEYQWNACDTSTADSRTDLWNPVEDGGSVYGCVLTAKIDSFLDRVLDKIPNGSNLKPFGNNQFVTSRVIWEVSPLPPYSYTLGGIRFDESRNANGTVTSSRANLPFVPLTIAVAPEIVTAGFDDTIVDSPANDPRFTFPEPGDEPAHFDSTDYAILRNMYDPVAHPDTGAFSSLQQTLCNAGAPDGGKYGTTAQDGQSLTTTAVTEFPSDSFALDPLNPVSESATPTLSVPGVSWVLGCQSKIWHPLTPQPLPPSTPGVTTKQWRDLAASCVNPMTLARNAFVSGLYETIGRLGAFRLTTEFLVVNPKSSTSTVSPYDVAPNPVPPTIVTEMGEDPFAPKYQIPYVHFRNPNLFDTDPTTTGDEGTIGWPYPWTSSQVGNQTALYQARVTSQLRSCFHLYQRPWDDTTTATASSWITRYAFPFYNGGFSSDVTEQKSKIVNNRLNGGQVRLEDPNWLLPGSSTYTRTATADWATAKETESQHPWQLTSGSGDDFTFLRAPEVASMLGTVQSCPVDGEAKYSDGSSWSPCAKERDILRPDFVGLFLYLFPQDDTKNDQGSPTLNELFDTAGLAHYSYANMAFGYQSPGMWYTDARPDLSKLANPFNFATGSDDNRSNLNLISKRMRRTRNEESAVLIVTHKAPFPADQEIIRRLIGCSKRRIIVAYMPSGIYEPNYGSSNASGDIDLFYDNGELSDQQGLGAWSHTLFADAGCGDAVPQINRSRVILYLSPKNPEFDELKDQNGDPVPNPYTGATMNGWKKYRTYWLDMLNDKDLSIAPSNQRPYIYSGVLAQSVIRRLLTVQGYKY